MQSNLQLTATTAARTPAAQPARPSFKREDFTHPQLDGQICASSAFVGCLMTFGGVVEVRPNGEVRIAEGLTLSDAARAFWKGVADLSPGMFPAAAVVRHVSVEGGGKRAVAMLLDENLPDGARLHAWPNNDSNARDDLRPTHAPRLLSAAELMKVYHSLNGEAIVAGAEVGSAGDAILIAYGQAVLKAAGVGA